MSRATHWHTWYDERATQSDRTDNGLAQSKPTHTGSNKMDTLLALIFLGILSIAILLVISAYLICCQIDHHIALYQYGKSIARQQQRQTSNKRVIEIHIG